MKRDGQIAKDEAQELVAKLAAMSDEDLGAWVDRRLQERLTQPQ